MNPANTICKIRECNTQPTGSNCQACPSVGLPILPVRYAVVPKTLPGYALPGSCANPLLAPEDAGKVELKNTKYVLRTLRAGFLYLMYKDPASGASIWQCFMITPSGAIREIPLASKGRVLPKDPEQECQRAGHNINSSIISIRNPEKISKAYIAYSEHFWSQHALARNKKSIRPRMAEFSPSAWLKSQSQENAISVADVENSVVEYSNANLEKHLKEGLFGYMPRAGQAASLRARMDKISPGKGMILAIPDPIGCVSDLNSYRMHVANEFHEYMRNEETIWKLSSATQIDGLRACVAAQVKDSMKDAKPKRIGNTRAGNLRTVSKDEQIKTAVQETLAKLEDHYHENERTAFLDKFKINCDDYEARILKLDSDYVSWKESTTLEVAMSDYDRVPGYSCIAGSEVICRLLEGGPLSKVSIESWKNELLRDAMDLKNYAIAGILFNQEEWLKRFKNADAKNLIDHVWGDNHGKIFDFVKNFVEADEIKTKNEAINNVTNIAVRQLMTVSGGIAGVIADLTKAGAKKTANTADAATLKAIAALEDLQVKMAAAHTHLHTKTNFVVFTIELTVNEWQRTISGQLKKTMEKVSKQATRGFSSMAIAASAHLPPGSASSTKLIAFTYWMSGTVEEITEAITHLGGGASDIAARATKAATQGVVAATGAVAQAGVSKTGAAAGGSANGLRAIRVLGHSLPAKLMAQFPTTLSSTAAGAFAIRISRNSLTMLASGDVKLAAPALGLQIYSLTKSWNDLNNSSGFKHQDAGWSVASGVLGVASASVDLAGKAWKAIRVTPTMTIHAKSAAVITGAAFLGAGASIIDCVQMIIRTNVAAKRGDSDAAWYHGIAAVFAAGAAGASVGMAFGLTTLMGPVGLLLICIVGGVALTYLAFSAQDSAIDIWLDRSKFGKKRRIEGAFLSRGNEADALELIHRSISIELEWLDKPLTSYSTNEISISIKRPGRQNDALILGLVIEGAAGARKALYLQQGLRKADTHYNSGWPVILSKLKSANPKDGGDFEARLLKGESSVHHYKEDELPVTAWEEVIELDPEKFSRARLKVRYFPDRDDGLNFFDDELSVVD